jgi:hypothetical protein
MQWRAIALGLVLFATLGACDLVEDATAFTFCNADEQVTLDLSALDAVVSGGELPQVPCGAQNDCSGAEQLIDCTGQSFGCDLRCLGAAAEQPGLCDVELSATVEQGVQISLANEVNRKFQSVSLVDVTLTRLEYSVLTNTLTAPVPQTDLLVGPEDASVASSPDVVLLAELPEIPAGATPQEQTIETEPDGRVALTRFAKNYETPFRAFGRTTLVSRSGEALSAGTLTLSLKACFKAKPGN